LVAADVDQAVATAEAVLAGLLVAAVVAMADAEAAVLLAAALADDFLVTADAAVDANCSLAD
jgi:hypothetical protein